MYNEKLTNWLPQYFAQFDAPAVWEGNTCINTVMKGQYKVRLVLNEITIGGHFGCTPSISIWDGTDYIEQIEWPGEINNYLGHIIGSCVRAIGENIGDQTWVFMVADINSRIPYMLTDILGQLEAMYHNEAAPYYGIARRDSSNYVVSGAHMREIRAYYETKNGISRSTELRPAESDGVEIEGRWRRHSGVGKRHTNRSRIGTN